MKRQEEGEARQENRALPSGTRLGDTQNRPLQPGLRQGLPPDPFLVLLSDVGETHTRSAQRPHNTRITSGTGARRRASTRRRLQSYAERRREMLSAASDCWLAFIPSVSRELAISESCSATWHNDIQAIF